MCAYKSSGVKFLKTPKSQVLSSWLHKFNWLYTQSTTGLYPSLQYLGLSDRSAKYIQILFNCWVSVISPAWKKATLHFCIIARMASSNNQAVLPRFSGPIKPTNPPLIKWSLSISPKSSGYEISRSSSLLNAISTRSKASSLDSSRPTLSSSNTVGL